MTFFHVPSRREVDAPPPDTMQPINAVFTAGGKCGFVPPIFANGSRYVDFNMQHEVVTVERQF